MKKRVISLFITCSLVLSGMTIPASADSGSLSNFTKHTVYHEGQYSDVNAQCWFSDNIKAGTEYGIVKGYGDRFGVNDNITLLQCIIIACRLHTLYTIGADTIESSGASLEEAYLAYASAHGIRCSFSDLNAAATRAQFAAILSDALPDEALPAKNSVVNGSIPDVADGDKYADEIYRLYRSGILTGVDGSGRFLPHSSIIRCEACVIATRMVDPALRKSFTLTANNSIASKTKEPLYKMQWALAESSTFALKEKQNKYPVYEPSTDKFYTPYTWSIPEEAHAAGNATSITASADADINIEQAWKLYNGGVRETVVAIIDTGVDINHEDLKDSVWINADEIPDNGIDDDNNGYIDDVHGWNFFDDTNQVYVDSEQDAHGTHCAGTIAANAANGTGIAGIAYSPNVKIMVLKVFGGAGGSGKMQYIADAIRYAEDNGAAICNMSLSGMSGKSTLYDLISHSKMLFVAATGNSGMNNDKWSVYPASFDLDNVISVANLYCDRTLYTYSNYGASSVDLAAPGTYILSTAPENNYQFMTGTSMATPMVTAAAAMIYSHYPSITPTQVKQLILRTARPLECLKGKCVTGGTLDLGAAMQYDIGLL